MQHRFKEVLGVHAHRDNHKLNTFRSYGRPCKFAIVERRNTLVEVIFAFFHGDDLELLESTRRLHV